MKKPLFKPFASHNIRNIIFDLGGVIINLDYGKTIDSFIKLGFKNFEQIFSQARQTGLFDRLDRGAISPYEFRTQLRNLGPTGVTDAQINEAWNAMLLDFPSQRLELLARLKTHYRTFLLSNTNAIHFDAYNQTLRQKFGLDNLSGFFEREYYSHMVHMRKPDVEVFEFILCQNGLQAQETLFIDDSIQHVEGARQLGILAYHLDLSKGQTIEEHFQ